MLLSVTLPCSKIRHEFTELSTPKIFVVPRGAHRAFAHCPVSQSVTDSISHIINFVIFISRIVHHATINKKLSVELQVRYT